MSESDGLTLSLAPWPIHIYKMWHFISSLSSISSNLCIPEMQAVISASALPRYHAAQSWCFIIPATMVNDRNSLDHSHMWQCDGVRSRGPTRVPPQNKHLRREYGRSQIYDCKLKVQTAVCRTAICLSFPFCSVSKNSALCCSAIRLASRTENLTLTVAWVMIPLAWLRSDVWANCQFAVETSQLTLINRRTRFSWQRAF